MKFPTSPVADLQEAKSGDFEIKLIPIKTTALVSMREAIMTGRRPKTLNFDPPLMCRFLSQKDVGTIMSDLPVELRQMKEAVDRLRPQGRVLIGGLGLGILTRMVAAKRLVSHVDVVELEQDVVKLCNPHHKKISIIVADILSFVQTTPVWPWKSAFIDTWSGDNEGTWWQHVFPVRRAIANRFPMARMDFWAEDIMQGQIFRALTNGRPHWYYENLPLPMTYAEASFFLSSVGLPKWEEKYGACISTKIGD